MSCSRGLSRYDGFAALAMQEIFLQENEVKLKMIDRLLSALSVTAVCYFLAVTVLAILSLHYLIFVVRH